MIGVEDKETGFALPFPEYSQVKFMITHIGFPKTYLDEIATRNDVAKEKAEALMMLDSFKEEKPMYSKGGLSFEITMIEVNGDEISELYSQNIIHLPTPKVWEKCRASYDKGNAYGYNFQQNGFSTKKTRAGDVAVFKLHPDPNITKDWKTGVVANNIPIGCEETYRELIDKEKDRMQQWEDVCKLWHGISEEVALADIYEGFARRFGLMNPADEKNYNILVPKVGMTFTARLKITKGKYWSPQLFEFNMNSKRWDIYTSLEVQEPAATDILRAKALHKAIEDKRNAAIAKKKEETANNSEDVLDVMNVNDEEVPF